MRLLSAGSVRSYSMKRKSIDLQLEEGLIVIYSEYYMYLCGIIH